ncbi:MAG: fumarylacetoacetate hydrolase family protein [Promethearchaeota archaeon]
MANQNRKMIKLHVPGRNETYILHPTKIICLGKNYPAHAKEMDSDVPDEPLFFCKTPTCLIPNNEHIALPKPELGIRRVDHEIELAVIIGKTAKDVPSESALDHVLGYTIFNDVTARDLQSKDRSRGWPWFRSKNLDTFGPIGPNLVLKDDLNPNNLEMTLKVNGEIRQHGFTRDMHFKIDQLISIISGFLTLEEGDIISTGTPAGVGPLQDGDVVKAEIGAIGTLINPVKKEK